MRVIDAEPGVPAPRAVLTLAMVIAHSATFSSLSACTRTT